MFGLGTPELIIIFLGILILFGAPKIPELARSLGRSIRILREEFSGLKRQIESTTESVKEATKIDLSPTLSSQLGRRSDLGNVEEKAETNTQ